MSNHTKQQQQQQPKQTDFDRNASPKDTQIEVFRRQVVRAAELGVPIVVHSRRAAQETYDSLVAVAPRDMRIHLHCFTDTPDWAARYLAAFPNLYIGATCAVLKAGSPMARSVAAVPLARLVLETDAPYMPLPGSRSSSPATVPAVAQAVADLHHATLAEVLDACYANTCAVYGIM